MDKRKYMILSLVVAMVILFSACAQTEKTDPKEIADLMAEIGQLKTENDKLTHQNEALQASLNKQKDETTVQSEDVTVLMTGKSTSNSQFGQLYAGVLFSITNNTEKTIKGVQGTATFKDLFGVDIISVSCDFTGITLEPGSTTNIDEMYYECNQFMNDHMKLYSTAYEDLKLEYKTTMIVFDDGSSKTK